jgi:hypothetical protein
MHLWIEGDTVWIFHAKKDYDETKQNILVMSWYDMKSKKFTILFEFGLDAVRYCLLL